MKSATKSELEDKSVVYLVLLSAEGKVVKFSHYSSIEPFMSVEQKITLTQVKGIGLLVRALATTLLLAWT